MHDQSKIVGTRYVLAVQDIKRSARYYEKNLGFTSIWAGDGWHFLQREKCIIMLSECPEESSAFETKNHSYFGYLDVEHIDELYREFQSKDVEILGEIEDKPWGQREFALRTVDGHRIMFGEKMEF